MDDTTPSGHSPTRQYAIETAAPLAKTPRTTLRWRLCVRMAAAMIEKVPEMAKTSQIPPPPSALQGLSISTMSLRDQYGATISQMPIGRLANIRKIPTAQARADVTNLRMRANDRVERPAALPLDALSKPAAAGRKGAARCTSRSAPTRC